MILYHLVVASNLCFTARAVESLARRQNLGAVFRDVKAQLRCADVKRREDEYHNTHESGDDDWF